MKPFAQSPQTGSGRTRIRIQKYLIRKPSFLLFHIDPIRVCRVGRGLSRNL